MKCRRCGFRFDSSAGRCPHCGADVPKTGMLAWLVLLIVVLLVALMLNTK